MAFSRKRTFAGASRTWGAKRRRTAGKFRRPKFRRRRNAGNASSSGARTVSTGYRGRKMRPRAWRRALFNSTNFKSHFRSLYSNAFNLTTPASLITASCGYQPMISDEFWIQANGARPPVAAGATPFANLDDLVIRGGSSRIGFANSTTNSLVRVRLWKLRLTHDGSIPIGTPNTIGWDPTLDPDWQKFYTVLEGKQFILAPLEAIEHSHFFGCMKIDADIWDNGDRRFYWAWSGENMTSAAAVAVNVTISHNVSFTVG